MGHYDDCRPENCATCGQLKGHCEHTKEEPISSIQEMFNAMEDSCSPMGIPENRNDEPLGTALLGWSAKGIGFGSFYFYEKKDDNNNTKLYCENECMSKEFIKRMLCVMVDNAIINDPNSKDEKDDKS